MLLTTRSKELRTHAGQTALPGGKMDEADNNLVETAVSRYLGAFNEADFHITFKFREAFEEVRLPLNSPSIYTIGMLAPFLSLHRLVVTPIIALLTEPSVVDTLKASEGEVSRIFSHPLEALLDPTLALREPLVPATSEDWPYATELHVIDSYCKSPFQVNDRKSTGHNRFGGRIP